MKLGYVTVVVKDQEEALAFYTDKLGLEKRQDMSFGPVRWLTVSPKGQEQPEIVLMPSESLGAEIDPGTGAPWIFVTDDCRRDFAALKARGVQFTDEPDEQPFGVQAGFVDPYGNAFNLVQPAAV